LSGTEGRFVNKSPKNLFWFCKPLIGYKIKCHIFCSKAEKVRNLFFE